MLRHAPIILAGLALTMAILACTIGSLGFGPAATQTPAAALTDTPSSASTAAPPPTDTPAAAALPTELQATIPAFLTSVPGIAATLTAVYATPGVAGTFAAQQTMQAGTQAAIAPQLSGTLLSQCPHPSDPPMQAWQDIPVMPQATAGQEVKTLVGSYYCFRAPVKVQDMEAFYKGKLAAPQWILESDVNGTMEFVGLTQAGAQLVTIASGLGDQNDLIVALNVSRPVGIPTP